MHYRARYWMSAALTIMTLGWSTTTLADTASDFLTINDDAGDDSTVMELENAGFDDAGLCLQNGNLEFFVNGSCAVSNQEMTLNPNGNLGIGTGTPLRDIHLLSGDTPAIRLDQSNDQGWGAYTWDVAANETNFFIRDVSNSSTLPFRIRTGAPANSLYISGAGDVGFGTPNASAPVHVVRSDDTFEMLHLDQNNTNVVQDRNMMQLDNNGGIRFEFLNTHLNTSWRFQAATGNRDVFEIAKVGTGNIELRVDASGNLDVLGTVNSSSSRTVKTAIEPVVVEEALARVAELPIAEWSYIRDESDLRHIGPMAEDFYAAFGLGADDKHIAPQDLAGVAVAAIKALKQRSDKQQARIEELEHQNEELRANLSDIEELKDQVAALQAALANRQVASRDQ